LLDSLSKLLSNKLNNIISQKGNFSAVLNSDKNTTQGNFDDNISFKVSPSEKLPMFQKYFSILKNLSQKDL